MSNPVVPNRLPFDENINILLEELVLAGKWERPSILLAVHKSKFGQAKAQAALAARLEKLGQPVTRLAVDKEHSDVPHQIEAMPNARRSVFFVSNMDWGAGTDHKDAYRALNIYREIFVDNHLRLVVWLTINEAATLARLAPDFWAFRHRVIEFTGQRIPKQVQLPAGVLLWNVETTVDPYDKLEARIAVREDLLSRLPRNSEARSSRVDLLFNLGYLYWTGGSIEKATQQLSSGLELTGSEPGDNFRAQLLNGLAIIAYEARQFSQAADLLRQALQDDPENASHLINLSAVCNALGRNQDAATFLKKAIKNGVRDPNVWNAAGYVDIAMGKFDDAVAAFSRALELAPRMASLHAAAAICYDLVERTEETMQHLALARTLAADKQLIFLDMYEAALAGDTDGALEFASAAVHTQQLSVYDLKRDPGLGLLLERSQIEAIPGLRLNRSAG